MSDFPADLYAGTAEYYERYRPRYPDFMLGDVRARVGVGGTLVDLACGTGQIAVPMARHFDDVLAVDQEPDMIDMGRAVAGRAGIANIRWQHGRAEDLDIVAGTVHVLSIGSAFHRLDRERIAGKAKEWLRPDGSLVVMGYGDPPNEPPRTQPWQDVMSKVIRKWTGPPSEAVVRAMSGPLHREVLDSAGYETEQYEWTMPRRWTLDELIGLRFSISVSSKRQLGDKADGMEAELRSALLDVDDSGEYDEQLRYFAVIARPPAVH